MTAPIDISFVAHEDGTLAAASGTVVALARGAEGLLPGAQAADAAMGGALTRAVAAAEWKGKAGDTLRVAAPAGLAADALLLVGVGEGAEDARKAGAAVAAALAGKAGGARGGGGMYG